VIAFKVMLSSVRARELLPEGLAHCPAEVAVKLLQGRLWIACQFAVIDAVVVARVHLLPKSEQMLKSAHGKAGIGFRFRSILLQAARVGAPDRPEYVHV
jgi:hypothetical protein